MSTEIAKTNGAPIGQATQQGGGGALVPSNFEQALKLAEMMSRSELVPKHLQGKPADCFLVIEQSVRWGMSPFAAAQSTSVISGKLMFEGKLVLAVLNARGDFDERISFEYSGEGNARAVRVSGRLRGESAPRTVDVKLTDARTSNGMWVKQPDQQLAYHGARVWARRHLPELMLGVYSPEEWEQQPQGTQADVTPMASKDQVKALAASLGELSITGKAAIYEWISGQLGREVLSSADLSAAEAADLLARCAPKAIVAEVAPLPKAAAPALPAESAAPTSPVAAAPAPTAVTEREPGSDDDDETPTAGPVAPGLYHPSVAAAEAAFGVQAEFSDLVPVLVFKVESGTTKNHDARGEWVRVGDDPKRTSAQNARLHALRGELGIADDVWRSRLVANFGKESSADLSRDEASTLIEKLEASKAKWGTKATKDARKERRAASAAAELAPLIAADLAAEREAQR